MLISQGAHTTLIKKKNVEVRPSGHVCSAEVFITVIATWVVKEVLPAALTVTGQVHQVLKSGQSTLSLPVRRF